MQRKLTALSIGDVDVGTSIGRPFHKIVTSSLLSFFSIVSSGCTLGPDYERPELNLPALYSTSAEGSELRAHTPDQSLSKDVSTLAWWELLADDALTELVRIGLDQNFNRAIAFERVQEARAILGFVRADQFPMLSLSGGSSRTQFSDAAQLGAGVLGEEHAIYMNLAFEIDLWGRLARATQAERERLLASEYAYRAITIALISEIARTYFQLRDVAFRQAIAEQTVKNRQDATWLVRTRFKGGIVAELDVNQAEIEEMSTVATMSAIQRERIQTENALNILLGRYPQPIPVPTVFEDNYVLPDIDAGIPAELLSRRPDVLSAEASAKAALAEIGVAQADRLPALRLTGRIGQLGSSEDDLASSSARTWRIGVDFLGPLLDWGKSASNVDIARALSQQALIEYRQTVAVAVREVEDAMASVRTFSKEYQSRRAQRDAAKNAVALVRTRYDEGIATYLEVLDIDRSLFQAELLASSSLQGYLSSIVQLYRAAGGGWDRDSELPPGQDVVINTLIEIH